MTDNGQSRLGQLSDFVTRQRWFGDKGRPGTAVALHHSDWLVEGVVDQGQRPVRVAFLTYAFDDGGRSTYQVPLTYRAGEAEERTLIGTWSEPDLDGARVSVSDAMQDREGAQALLDAIGRQRTVGDLRFEQVVPDALGSEWSSLRPLPITAEQSNTSVMFGDVAIFKLFRRVHPGLNPGVELESRLTELECPDIPAVFGTMSGAWSDGETQHDGDLGILTEFQRSATEGWAFATASVRDLFHGDIDRATQAGGDFTAEARRLGEATARVHRDLVRGFGSAEADAGAVGSEADSMLSRLRAAAEEIPPLRPLVPRLTDVFNRLRDRTEPIQVQRIHGDYHLGQTLRTTGGWKLIDFEGEPAKPMSVRRAMSSPLRDVAGMLRSFDYVVKSRLVDMTATEERDHLEARGDDWVQRNSEAFLAGYASGTARDPRADPELLDAFVLDKLVYELMYEARNRPGWLRIPLLAVERLVRG